MGLYEKLVDKNTLDRLDNLVSTMSKDMEKLKRKVKDLEDKLSKLEDK